MYLFDKAGKTKNISLTCLLRSLYTAFAASFYHTNLHGAAQSSRENLSSLLVHRAQAALAAYFLSASVCIKRCY